MALKGLDIFKVSPKKNCKECGSPTCMSFCMKVAQGAVSIDQCPYFDTNAKEALLEASEPPMKTISVSSRSSSYEIGGETVLFRHEKTFVNRTRFAVSIDSDLSDEEIEKKLNRVQQIDYERIGEHMVVEMIYLNYVPSAGKDRYLSIVKKAAATGRVLIFGCSDYEVASEALLLTKGMKPILDGADSSNYERMNTLAKENDAVLNVHGSDMDELYDTIAALEKLGNKNLIFDAGMSSVKEAYQRTVQFRRAAVKDGNHTCGYPSLVRLDILTKGDEHLCAALLSLFTVKYGSVIVVDEMPYSLANPAFALRQDLFSDPQKPMKVEPGIYPLNGGDENSICVTTVDFALTYYLVSNELIRSGVPLNLIITDAGGYSVLTSWAAGKFSADTISAFFRDRNIESRIKSRKLIIPGKTAVLKSDLEKKMPGWEIIVGPNEASQLVKFIKDLTA